MDAKLITLNLIDKKLEELGKRIPKLKHGGSGLREQLEKDYEELQYARQKLGNLKF